MNIDMKIGLCDDVLSVIEELHNYITQSLEKINAKAELILFTSGIDLIERVKELDAVFLDVRMPDIDGYQVGKEINNINKYCKIIMATGWHDNFVEGFKIGAFRYIKKPFKTCEIDEIIKALYESRTTDVTLSMYYKRVPYDIPQKKIAYLKATNGYVQARVGELYYRKDIPLAEIEQELSNKIFIRINRTYIVNRYFIDDVKNSAVKIGERYIKITRNERRNFINTYTTFH